MNRIYVTIYFIFIVFSSQAQVSKTVNISAGGLSKALSTEEKNTITHLTITGTTDARDFKTMRDSMALISVVDMGSATILAYTGSLGPNSFSTSYPANCIPESAFNKSTWKTSLTSFTMPSSLTAIGGAAFNGCSSLQSVVVPSLVTTIGSSAFMYCSGLSSISIPASVTNIASSSVFAYCKGDITVSESNPNYSSADGVLFNKAKTVLMHCPASKSGSYTIPSSVTQLDGFAFANCMYLTSITIPTTVTSIGYEAFHQCKKLTSLILPPGLTTIESSTFSLCEKLTSLVIPSKVTSIGDGAFFDCRALTSITIPISVTEIYGNAFAYCSALTSIYADSPVPVDLSTVTDVFLGINKTTCRLLVPYMTSELYDISNQWSDFTNITDRPGFYLPDTRADLSSTQGSTDSLLIYSNVPWTLSEDQTWLTLNTTSGTGNDKLILTANANPGYTDRKTTVTISATGLPSQSITVVQYGIPKTFFVSAGGLSTTLTSDEKNTTSNMKLKGTIDARDFKTMRDNMPALSNVDLSGVSISGYTGTLGTNGTSSIAYPENVVPEYAFCVPVSRIGKNSLNSVILPATSTSVSSYAFYGCKNTTRITLSPSVTEIGDYSFYGCTGLYTIDLPSLLSTIGNYAFYGCKGLTSITNKAALTSIGNNAFYDCSGFTSFLFPATLKTIGNYAFKNCKRLASIAIPEQTTTIGYYAFDGCCHLKSASIASALTEIENGLFYGCNDLASFTIPATVTSIGSHAFGYCYDLTALTIPPLVQTIGSSSFAYCTRLTTIEIPPLVSSIGSSAFIYCSSLTSISLPPTITTIDDYTFCRCYKLSSINIPSSVKAIGRHALQDCNFTSLEIPSSVTSIGNYAFCDNSNLTSITIPTSVTSMGSNVFSNCTSLPTVKIPNTITRIESSFFSSATSLSSFTIPSSVSYIGDHAFYMCIQLVYLKCDKETPIDINNSSQVFSGVNKNTCVLYVPYGSKTLYAAANQWKDFVKIVESSDAPIIPNILEIADSTISDGQNKCFNAYDTITVAGIDTVLLESGSAVELIAGRSIRFLPGFIAKPGCYLYGHITTDSTFCDDLPAPMMAAEPIVEKSAIGPLDEEDQPGPGSPGAAMKVFPNPNNGQFTVQFTNIESNTQVIIFNNLGQKVYETMVSGESQRIELPNIKRGIYLLKAISGQKQFDRKIMVQ